MSNHNKMLIDATHPEETRVVVLRNGRVEEFDYESAARKLLRGNIYLAKVIRVEPSLQAAFVDYGGNRHGFLAFSEIHPDYYQIPIADRQALLDEEAQAEAEEEAAADAAAERAAQRAQRRQATQTAQPRDSEDDDEGDDAPIEAFGGEDAPSIGHDLHDAEPESEGEPTSLPPALAAAMAASAAQSELPPAAHAGPSNGDATTDAPRPIGLVEDAGVHDVDGNGNGHGAAAESEPIEEVGSEDAMEEVPSRPRRRMRSYKIQEVIKRRQVILVQVVKEERGNKGAALTTYLSLAGRYTVLMPNTNRGGGISRKITQPQDRKRLKAIAHELEVPEGMGLIIRTAGAARTKQEVKRDFEYLLRLWESVRDMTLQSTAPSLVYEEGNLIKRSIRDLYTKDVEEIVVAGEPAFVEARDFMRMLMPSHAKNVILDTSREPLFTRFQIERQLGAMFSPYVTLKSGGYLVINQTEALVAIDINSGKSTREFSIEETALNTNLEAADEIARQLKLRDLAGLIVIDFIDMEEKRNNRAVERRVKDALRFDRARIQVGRISHFGLLEMSRQRMRTGVLEGSTSQCPHCQGTGIIRSVESVALAVLRGLEDALMGTARNNLVATTTAQVALYILNNKRPYIVDMETRAGVTIVVQASDKLQGANFTIERAAGPVQPPRRVERAAVSMDWGFEGEGEAEIEVEEAPEPAEAEIEELATGTGAEDEGEAQEQEGGGRRRRRRRRGRRGSEGPRSGEASGVQARATGDDDGPEAAAGSRQDGEGANGEDDEVGEPSEAGMAAADGEAGEADDTVEGDRGERRGRGRRRGRRGGRRGRERGREDGAAGPLGASTEDMGGIYAEGIAGMGPQPDVDAPVSRLPAAERSPLPVAVTGPIIDWDQRPGPVATFDVGTSTAPIAETSSRRDPTAPRETSPPAEVSTDLVARDQAAAADLAAAELPASAQSSASVAPIAAPAHTATTPVAPTPSAPQPTRVEQPAATPSEAAEPVVHKPAEPAPSHPEIPEPPAPPSAPRLRRSLETTAEPRLERVVVRPDGTAQVSEESKSQPEPEATPARRGWWTRRFGGN